MVKRYICNVQLAVRFCLGPPFQICDENLGSFIRLRLSGVIFFEKSVDKLVLILV